VIDATEAVRIGLVSRVVDAPRTVATDHAAVRAIEGLLGDVADHDRQQAREREAFPSLITARAQKRKD
jgi:enoyl-CoA hydratase/carnithine racemase